MAVFEKALQKLYLVEFGNNPSKALHTVSGDTGGMTYKGIARNKHRDWGGWAIIDAHQGKVEDLENIAPLQKMVKDFYRKNFWNVIRGDEIAVQQVADNIFLFGVNVGMPIAIKTAQGIVGVAQDGIMGKATVSAINRFDPANFCTMFTAHEKAYYRKIVAKNPNFAKFLKGWENRAEVV